MPELQLADRVRDLFWIKLVVVMIWRERANARLPNKILNQNHQNLSSARAMARGKKPGLRGD